MMAQKSGQRNNPSPFLARSPQYTPEEADSLLDVIRGFFTEA